MENTAFSIQPTDPTSPIPLYFQVENDLRRLIYEEGLQPGETVPPEHELARAYQVSRHTIRQALARLEADDLISRGAGRGTTVKPRKNLTKLSVARSFTTEMEALGYTTRSDIIEMSEDVVLESPVEALQKYAGAACLNLTRLRFANDEPVCIQYSTILTDKCPDLAEHNFATRSLYEVLSETYQLYISEIQYGLSAQLADRVMAELLHIDKNTPLLVVSTTALLENGDVMEHSESFYRADRYQYSITHQLHSRSNSPP